MSETDAYQARWPETGWRVLLREKIASLGGFAPLGGISAVSATDAATGLLLRAPVVRRCAEGASGP